jgi:hypothetical protein
VHRLCRRPWRLELQDPRRLAGGGLTVAGPGRRTARVQDPDHVGHVDAYVGMPTANSLPCRRPQVRRADGSQSALIASHSLPTVPSDGGGFD